ncbi:GNAT family N-acetyltransferase [Spirillospora sp. NPDC047279]|uniref:GNAT family N-acetyltransferase n=1 Tax=Spirillospora sp. NPDC047279 TaxID=3155478 RepID=UPI0033C17987
MEIRIEPWSEDDLALLREVNAPEMKRHLGGPETDEQVLARHRRYLETVPPDGQMYTIAVDGEKSGTIGFWEKRWQGRPVYETGWSVLPGFQGRGVAVAATRLIIEAARAQRRNGDLYAYPSVDNAASNAICRKAGFTFDSVSDFEYPPGHMMRSNVWRFDLTG